MLVITNALKNSTSTYLYMNLTQKLQLHEQMAVFADFYMRGVFEKIVNTYN